jgi:hypothetical protein
MFCDGLGNKVPLDRESFKKFRVPKYLYHGTMLNNYIRITKEGLTPRGTRPSHDAAIGLPSCSDMVYLTSSWCTALEHACRIIARSVTFEGDKCEYREFPVVLQVKTRSLDRELFYPDEDWVGAEFMKADAYKALNFTVPYMEYYKNYWKESLFDHQRIAYKGTIKPGDLKSIVKKAGHRSWSDFISLLIYTHSKEGHRRCSLAELARMTKLNERLRAITLFHTCNNDQGEGQ